MPEESDKKTQTPRALRISGPAQTLVETSLQRRDTVVIGRGTDCDVVVHDLKASRRHCQLTRQQDGFLLEDLGSKNGTFVDGIRITQPVMLKAQHTFTVGDTVFFLA